jgi:RNA polymerase sigma factor (sigma-70 family)
MPAPLRAAILSLVRGLPPADGTADAALLERFRTWRDEAAFELLVYRHGPMVRGLCRRVLRHEQDAEDAFQATFLALARQARSVCGASLAGWLYRVAFHAALKARAKALRRGTDMLPDEIGRDADPADALLAREVKAVLDEVVMRLPARYRLPVVLCYLQGRSNAEAAAELGCPKGTVDSRLSEARRRLRGRLVRRGLTPAAGLALEWVLGPAADAAESAAVVRPVARAAVAFVTNQPTAAGAVPASAAALAHEVLHAMYLSNLTWAAAPVLTLGLFGSGAGVATYEALANGQAPAKESVQADPPPKDAPKPAQPGQPPAQPGQPPAVDLKAATYAFTHAGPTDAGGVRKLLQRPVTIDKALENAPLKDILEFLSDKYNFTVRIDPAPFARLGLNDPYQMYNAQLFVPPLRGVSLGEVLRTVLAVVPPMPIDGRTLPLTYVVRGSEVVIVPAPLAPSPDGTHTAQVRHIIHEQRLGEPVTVEFLDRPLVEVLRELADATGASIVLDGRAKDAGQTPVTVSLQQVRLLKALEVIADMADLRPVAIGNVYYVTTRDNAHNLAAGERPANEPPPMPPPAKPAPPAKPGGK